MAMWLAFGKRVSATFGNHPHDPDDMDRCLKLLAKVPALREQLPKMAEVSKTWAALVERWAEIEAMQMDEIGLNWTKARSAPKTYALMQEVIEGAKKRPNVKAKATGATSGSQKQEAANPGRLEPLVTPSEFLDRLTDFLGDSEGMTTEEVKAELREEGIDIDAMTERAKKMIAEKTKEAKMEDPEDDDGGICPRCNCCSQVWIECENCEDGFSDHYCGEDCDCGEDCCCCIDPYPNVTCDICEGKSGCYVCGGGCDGDGKHTEVAKI